MSILRLPRRLLIWLLLWLFFLACAAFALVVTLVDVALRESTYGNHLLRAVDLFVAVALGFSGLHTVSAECGVGTSLFCRTLRRVLDTIDPDGGGHCVRAARDEGML